MDTLYRIHGTAIPASIGKAVSSSCISLLNADVVDLYERVPTGTRVVVLQNAPRLDSETKKSKGGLFSLFRRRENDEALR